ncbi:MAG: tetratricopeptide repeat protein [Verrucomicrobiota bacterium JB024]|nr:tetratricopeptide repeat protein [Verrucomicrobiota bacterium JB024]
MKKSACLLLLLLIHACPALSAGDQSLPTEGEITCDYPVEQVPELIQQGQSARAIKDILQPAIDQLHAAQKTNKQQFYCSRTDTETLLYLLGVAAGKPVRPTDKDSACIVDYHFALALYYYGYIEAAKGDNAQAVNYLNQALALSPMNAMFLSELGYVYTKEGQMQQALEILQQAEEAADGFSPEALKLSEKTRAMRMQGYIYIEQRQFDKARAIYRQCLALNPQDRQAQNELDYIDQMLKRSPKPASAK